MDDLCRCCLTIRGGELLNQLILLEENESNARKKEFYKCLFRNFSTCRDVLLATSREYFRMMQEYLYQGRVHDPFDVIPAGVG